MRPIVLVGMPGSGKSTVGPLLADRLQLPFFDSDVEVERRAGMTIAQLFDAGGEAAFRAEERRVMIELASGPPAVVAAGGGAILDLRTRALLIERCTVVWLKADMETLARRLGTCPNRPLLRGGDPLQLLRRMLEEREPLYAEAPIHVPSAREPPRETAARVERLLTAASPSLALGAGREADCPE